MRQILQLLALAQRLTDPKAEDMALELDELLELTASARERRAMAQALDALLQNDKLDHEAHALVLTRLHALEKEVAVMDLQLSRVGEIERELTTQAADEVIVEELGRQGATHMVPMLAKLIREDRGIGVAFDSDGAVKIDRDRLAREIELLKGEPGFVPLFCEAPAGDEVTVNPWMRQSFNLTSQGEILRRDPALARRLQEEAMAEKRKVEQPTLTEIGALYRKDPRRARELALRHGINIEPEIL